MKQSDAGWSHPVTTVSRIVMCWPQVIPPRCHQRRRLQWRVHEEQQNQEHHLELQRIMATAAAVVVEEEEEGTAASLCEASLCCCESHWKRPWWVHYPSPLPPFPRTRQLCKAIRHQQPLPFFALRFWVQDAHSVWTLAVCRIFSRFQRENNPILSKDAKQETRLC
jgi:hypothetical protein